MSKLPVENLFEIWFIDAPITLLYSICRSYVYPIKVIVVERLECNTDIEIMIDILNQHGIEILDKIKIMHPKYTQDKNLKRCQATLVATLISKFKNSTIVVRSGSGFLHYLSPWRKVTLLPHGFGDFKKVFETKNHLKDLVHLLFFSVHYLLYGWHKLRSSYFYKLASIHKSHSSTPFVDLSILSSSEYFTKQLGFLKNKIQEFRTNSFANVLLCLPALKSTDLMNVYTESSPEEWLHNQYHFFLKYATHNTLLIFKHHPAASCEETQMFKNMLNSSNINFIDASDFIHLNHQYLPVELFMHLLDFDLMVAAGTASVINKPEKLPAVIDLSSVPDISFRNAYLHLTSDYQRLSGDYSANIVT